MTGREETTVINKLFFFHGFCVNRKLSKGRNSSREWGNEETSDRRRRQRSNYDLLPKSWLKRKIGLFYPALSVDTKNKATWWRAVTVKASRTFLKDSLLNFSIISSQVSLESVSVSRFSRFFPRCFPPLSGETRRTRNHSLNKEIIIFRLKTFFKVQIPYLENPLCSLKHIRLLSPVSRTSVTLTRPCPESVCALIRLGPFNLYTKGRAESESVSCWDCPGAPESPSRLAGNRVSTVARRL